MGEGETKNPLKSLEAKINAAKKAVDPVEQVQNKFSAAEVGWRMIIELTAGVFIGFGVGYGLDFLFDTKPVFILILTLFGFAAGVKTMMRSASELQNRELAAQNSSEKEDVDG
jgi:ATP synthase protein I|tara:strand:+ start:893 stop:1231 length:339 start_codon:yes stop_codon:yes gene_type:complete